jgi:hypothetical protein
MYRTRSSYKALKDYGSGYDTKEEKGKRWRPIVYAVNWAGQLSAQLVS